MPDRILRAMDRPVIDHRGPDFPGLGRRVLDGMQSLFRCSGPVVIYPSSGTGAWEAALVNTLEAGQKVLVAETGHFACLWARLAARLGLDVETVASDWRSGADPERIAERLRADGRHAIRALCVVHNETSTGAISHIGEIRQAMDAAHHPALLVVDTISGLGCADFRQDDWGVDVAISGSQKGLMLPPGLAFNALSERAVELSSTSGMARSYWSWKQMLEANETGFFPFTPATNLLYGLAEAIDMLHEEGLEQVFARHRRHAEATRRAVRQWGLECQCAVDRDCSPVLTAVRLPADRDADRFRERVLEAFDLSLGNGLGRIAGRVFRIGHLGDFNDLMLLGTLGGIEMGFELAGIPQPGGGVEAAMRYLVQTGNGARNSA